MGILFTFFISRDWSVDVSPSTSASIDVNPAAKRMCSREMMDKAPIGVFWVVLKSTLEDYYSRSALEILLRDLLSIAQHLGNQESKLKRLGVVETWVAGCLIAGS